MKKRIITSKSILILAICAFIAAVLEGALFYNHSNVFFNTLLILQNGVNAFMFNPTVTLADALKLMEQNNDVLHNVVGYMYGVAVFAAPLCTVAAVCRMLENLLRVMIRFRKNRKWQHVLIFGWSSDVKAMLDNYVPENQGRKRFIHIIAGTSFPKDKKYELGKKGFAVHCFDFAGADDRTAAKLLKKAQADIAENIILFSENSVENFSHLQLFSISDGDGRFELPRGAKITCRCDDDNIAELILDYYNTDGGSSGRYLLDIVSIPELQIRRMFEELPLHTYNAGTDAPLARWDVRMLILGFGSLGRQALIRTVEQAAVHKDNRITVDVFDKDISRRAELFANRLSADTFVAEGSTVKLRNGVADGELTINFRNTDISYKSFYETVRKENSKQPYTYVLIAVDDANLGVGCALRLGRLFAECGREVPTVLRMDTDRRLAGYINGNGSAFSDVKLLEARSKVLSLETILAEELDLSAKKFHYFYSTIDISERQDADPAGEGASDAAAPTEEEIRALMDAKWQSISMFKRCSSKALAAHEPVKRMIFDRLAREHGSADAAERIDALIGKNGTLMRCSGRSWQLREDTDGFLEALQKDGFALDAAQLEHRRWCLFMAADGWRYGTRRNDSLKIHNCLMDFEDLLKDETGRRTIMYDLMPLMAEYLGRDPE